tara:strand:- start:311 stop:433 length:123 start_codon:yes stop_codon:yes gene_type:complete
MNLEIVLVEGVRVADPEVNLDPRHRQEKNPQHLRLRPVVE